MPCAQIEDVDAVKFLHTLDGLNVALGQVDNVDVVADAGSVGCIVVIAEYVNLLELTGSDLRYIREQVVRDTLGILSDQAALVSSDRVKITKQHDLPAVVRFPDICQDPLLHGLGLAVRVRRDPLGALLCDRDKSGVSVDRRGR